MKIMARPVIDFCHDRQMRDEESEAASEREMLMTVKPTPLATMQTTATSFRYTPRIPPGPPMVNISYKKTAEKVKQAKSLAGNPNMSNKSLGERTFDYFVENEE